MKLTLSDNEKKELLAFLPAYEDAEQLSLNEWVVDIYDVETPASLDIVFKGSSVFADGAEYLSFSEEEDGWYMSAPIEDGDAVVNLLKAIGAIGK